MWLVDTNSWECRYNILASVWVPVFQIAPGVPAMLQINVELYINSTEVVMIVISFVENPLSNFM